MDRKEWSGWTGTERQDWDGKDGLGWTGTDRLDWTGQDGMDRHGQVGLGWIGKKLSLSGKDGLAFSEVFSFIQGTEDLQENQTYQKNSLMISSPNKLSACFVRKYPNEKNT